MCACMPGKQDSIRIIICETWLVPTEHNDTLPITVCLLFLNKVEFMNQPVNNCPPCGNQ